MSSNTHQLGPSQREIYKILEEDGGELRVAQIADKSDRLSGKAVSRAIKPLVDKGLVNQRDPGDPRGWYLYSLEGDR